MIFNRITVRELVKDDSTAWQTLGATFYSRLMVGALLYLGLLLFVIFSGREDGALLLIYLQAE